MAQRKRAGPITQRSMDRNHPLLIAFSSCCLSQQLLTCTALALCAAMPMALLLPQPLLSATATFFLLCLLTSQHSQRDPHQGRPVGLQRQPGLPPQGTGGPGDTSVFPSPSGSSIPTSQPQADTSRNLQVGRRTGWCYSGKHLSNQLDHLGVFSIPVSLLLCPLAGPARSRAEQVFPVGTVLAICG